MNTSAKAANSFNFFLKKYRNTEQNVYNLFHPKPG